jgi:large repetitive protein
MRIRSGRLGVPGAQRRLGRQRRLGALSWGVGRACLAMSAVVMAISVGGLGLSSASATVATQTITFTSTPPAAPTYGSSYTVAATASSGLPVTFTVDASTSGVCSLSGATVKFTSIGTCTIDANQAGNAEYSPAPQEQQSTTAGPAAQTITITSAAPVGQVSGGPTYSVAASSAFGLPITFTIAPASTSVCSIAGPTTQTVAGSTGSVSGTTVNFIGAGTCTIDADQPGNANYQAATRAQQSIPVAIGLQAIRFSSVAPAAAGIGGSYRVAAYTGSGLMPTLAVAPTSQSVCSLSGGGAAGTLSVGTVKFTGVGTCEIDANQAGNATFAAAPQVLQSFKVAKGKAAGVTVVVKHRKTKLAVSGTLKLPKGITAGQGYSGTITVTALNGKKKLSKAVGKLSKTGRYSVTLSRGSSATSLTVTFSGNAVLAASTTKSKVA